MITTETIKELRDRTGVSVMQCKKALEETQGDIEKAIIVLRKQAGNAASKKSDRDLGAGTIQTYIHGNGTVGVMVQLSCETDFVSNNEDFKALAKDIAMHIAASNPDFLSTEDITEEDKVKVREVFENEVADSDKPTDIKEKMLQGKLDAYFDEKVLLNQKFIKNPDVTINSLIESAVQKFGEKTELTKFVRFEV